MSKQVIILRGLPGAGKSTFIKTLLALSNKTHANIAVHSTDQYFYTEGQYKFDPRLLEAHHSANLSAFKASLDKGVSLVICDNTNIEPWQFKPYLNAAQKADYEVEIVTVGLFSDPKAKAMYQRRNQHSVSQSVIDSMAEKSKRFNHTKQFSC